jgi:predicted alpha/beta superfamily hydrolase
MGEWLDYPADGRGPPAGIRVKVLRDVHSPRLGNHRDLLVCLPPSYDHGERAYPVIYMHDGQNLFDEATSFAGTWGLDAVLRSLAAEGVEVIVVGIPNAGPRRIDEYSPFPDGFRGGGLAEDYVDFLADRVKPAIDAAFRTRPDRDSTGILGSSLGGLVSLFAFFERPETFGAAGAMSPAFWFARRAIYPWVERQPWQPGRLWLDAGRSEGPFVVADATRMQDLLLRKGYRPGTDVECLLEENGRHDEASWGRRLPAALRFMLGASDAAAG